MRRWLVVAWAVTMSMTAVPSAFARTQTASSGNLTATFRFSGKYPNYSGERITIAQGGNVLYDQPVNSHLCGAACAPGAPDVKQSSVRVLDLEQNGQPDVVLDLFSGGAHCCSIEQIFSFAPATMTYVKTERNFGNPGVRIVDLNRDGRYEFLTADDSFAYRFTDFAASGLPIQILTFANRHFTGVTRRYPKLIAKDAAVWLGLFRQHYDDSVGFIAAWAADEYLLGHGKRVRRYLARQLKAGHLNSALSPEEPGGRRFVTILQNFLRERGYRR
jgi:hypothetical protein